MRGHRLGEWRASLRAFWSSSSFFFFLFIMSLKFLFIYERFFKTDAEEFTLRSLDVAAADHSCWDTVCVCKHAFIYKTLQKPSKYGIQGAISEPVLCRRLSSSHRPNTVRLRPHRVRPLISVYIDLAGCLMATLLLCQWLQLQRVELSRPQQFVSGLQRARTQARTHARPHTSRGKRMKHFLLVFPPVDSCGLLFISQLVSL